MMAVVRWFRSSYFLAAGTIVSAGVADWLFYGRVVGWTVALFAALLCGLLVVRHRGMLKTRPGRVAGIAVALLLAALVEEPTPLGILMMCVAVGFLVMLRKGDWVSSTTEWLWRWGNFLMTLPVRAVLDNRLAAKYFRRHPGARPAVERVVVRWILPLLGGVVFVVLFAAANPVVEEWLRNFSETMRRAFDWLPEVLSFGRVMLWVGVAVLVHGLLRHRLHGRRVRVVRPPVQRVGATGVSRRHELVIRCLVVFNVVFAVQTVLDVVYLYGGKALPAGMTYATYAHRGAYPLVATALLAGLFVLMAFRTGGAAQQSTVARGLVYVWIGQNVFLLISTIWRLVLYVDVYSLSRWRVAAMIWIVLVAVGFGWVVTMISRRKSVAWLLRVNVATLGAVFFVCAFISFDGVIAEFNVRHCREVEATGVPLDVEYLEGLGTDSLPALRWVEGRVQIETRGKVAAARMRLEGELREELADWRGWTYRRHRLAMAEAERGVEQAAVTKAESP